MPKNEKSLSDDTEKSQPDLEESNQTRESNNSPVQKAINAITDNVGGLWGMFSSVDKKLELEQKDQILTNIADFILDKVDWSENTLEISKNAACFLCQEEDSHLQTEVTPSQQTQRVIDAVQECLIAVNVHYEKFSDRELLLRRTEIFSINASTQNPTLTQIKEEISWDSLPSHIREIFLKENTQKIPFNFYSHQE